MPRNSLEVVAQKNSMARLSRVENQGDHDEVKSKKKSIRECFSRFLDREKLENLYQALDFSASLVSISGGLFAPTISRGAMIIGRSIRLHKEARSSRQ